MTSTALLRREIRALVFDQYATVVDMQKGLTEAVPVPVRQGMGGQRAPVRHLVGRTRFEKSTIDALCARGRHALSRKQTDLTP